MTSDPNPQSDILKLAWSWIAAPELQMPSVPKSPDGSTGQYRSFTYDQTQRAYIVPRTKVGPEAINFHLTSIYDDDYLHGTMWLVNPAIVVKNWNQSGVGISLKLDDATLANGTDFRFGFEQTKAGRDLVIWLKKTINLTAAEEHRVAVSILPIRKF